MLFVLCASTAITYRCKASILTTSTNIVFINLVRLRLKNKDFLIKIKKSKFIVNDLNEQTNTLPLNNDQDTSSNKEVRNNSNSCICAKIFQCYKKKPKKPANFVYTNAQLELTERAEWQYGPRDLEKLEVFSCKTDQGHKIACLFVRCLNTPKFTILFSHGNAVDIGQMSSFYYGLGSRLDCNIFTYDYSGEFEF